MKTWSFMLTGLLLLGLPAGASAQFTFTTNADSTITVTGYSGNPTALDIPGTLNGYPVTTIGTNAFYFKSTMTNVTIPDSVTGIGDWAFGQCTGLANVTMGDSVASIGGWAFAYCSGLREAVLPASVTSLGTDSFLLCSSLTNLTIPNSVTNIGEGAFVECYQLPSVAIPAGVLNIGADAFVECYGLTNIGVNAANPSYASAGGVLFDKTMSTLIQCPGGMAGTYAIPDSVTNLGDMAFYYCTSLTNVIIPDSVTSIGQWGFMGCSGLVSVTIPNRVANLSDSVFSSCSGLISATIPNSITNIGGDAFYACASLSNLTLGNNVRSIGFSAFKGCSRLVTLTIPDSVTMIDDWAFIDCTGLTNVVIGNSVTNLGLYAFWNCPGLQQAYFRGNAPSVDGAAGGTDSTVFGGESGTAYFVPGTAGWSGTFGGWPTAWWYQYQPQPRILGSDYGSGVRSNGFHFTIFWATNAAVVVDACTNLASPNWQPMQTNTLTTGSADFSDWQWTNFPSRYYRVRLQQAQ